MTSLKAVGVWFDTAFDQVLEFFVTPLNLIVFELEVHSAVRIVHKKSCKYTSAFSALGQCVGVLFVLRRWVYDRVVECMRIDVVCPLPQAIASFLDTGIVGRARERGIAEIYLHNLHDYADNRFGHIDDEPYGGGAGMVIRCQPVFDCIERLRADRQYDEIIYLTADGEQFTQSLANELSLHSSLILLAGRYKGIDQRVRDALVTREISIGDYVLSGGELAAAVVIDAVVRLLPGVMHDAESALDDSFQDGLLSAPVYTRPANFRGMEVPAVLRSGDHEAIRRWRMEQALLRTQIRRPDLLSHTGGDSSQ